jgi:hypothetical protein
LRSLLKRWRVAVLASLVLAAGAASAAAQEATTPKELKPYTSCRFSDDLQILRVDPLAPGVTARTVDTLDGSKQIDLDAGVQIIFGYFFGDSYANVKAEKLPDSKYSDLRKDLLANLQYALAHSPGTSMNKALPENLHKFEAYGEDRDKLEGGVLGMYLLFDNDTHVVATIYLLNQEASLRKFQTIEEYSHLRDRFLEKYTGCIRENQALYR